MLNIMAASLLDMTYHTLEAPVNIDIQSFEKEYFTEDRLNTRNRITIQEYIFHFISQVVMMQDITAIHGRQFLTMMHLKHLRKKVSSTRQ